MIATRHLPNAPIKEALIDIQVALPEKVETEKLHSGYGQISDLYPSHQIMQQGELGVHHDEGHPPRVTFDQTVVGYRYTSTDGRRVAQFRTDGFTFSRLEPYVTWEDMKADAVTLWKIYSKSVTPNTITRVATRYTNLLKLPLNTELDEYLVAPPVVPNGLDQKLTSFLTRIEIHMQSIGAHGILTQHLEGPREDHAPVVLDIDVFVAEQFDPHRGDFWECLDQLRMFKNTVFFESITEKTAEIYQ